MLFILTFFASSDKAVCTVCYIYFSFTLKCRILQRQKWWVCIIFISQYPRMWNRQLTKSYCKLGCHILRSMQEFLLMCSGLFNEYIVCKTFFLSQSVKVVILFPKVFRGFPSFHYHSFWQFFFVHLIAVSKNI